MVSADAAAVRLELALNHHVQQEKEKRRLINVSLLSSFRDESVCEMMPMTRSGQTMRICCSCWILLIVAIVVSAKPSGLHRRHHVAKAKGLRHDFPRCLQQPSIAYPSLFMDY